MNFIDAKKCKVFFLPSTKKKKKNAVLWTELSVNPRNEAIVNRVCNFDGIKQPINNRTVFQRFSFLVLLLTLNLYCRFM